MGDKGTTLLDGIIGMAIGLVVIASASQLFYNYAQDQSYSTAVATRNDLVAQLKALGSSLKTLEASANAPENLLLKNCLSGNGCNSNVNPLALYFQGSHVPFSGSSDGVNASPLYYKIDGTPCASNPTPGPECALEVTTSFVSQCAASPPSNLIPPPTCAGPPDVVEVIYNIQQVPGTTLGGAKAFLPPYTGTIIVQGS